MKKITAIILIIITAVSAGGYILLKSGKAKNPYEIAEIERGDLSENISCTGNLKLRNSVVVNFKISGTVAEVMADFNQKIRKGQPLASLDKTLLKLAVQTAEAGLLSAQNQLVQAKKNYDDTKFLFDKNFKSQADLDTAKISLDTAQVNLQTSRISLDSAKANLMFAVIYSPIDGIVIERNIEAGQSVASSEFNTVLTTNFFLASDTSKIQIFATVDENDISKIRKGQPVIFTVQSYQDKTFKGRVSQIRLKPVVSDNVVVYTIVADADNQDNLLIPGMTATLNIETDSRKNILMVPNTALKFQPPIEVSRLPQITGGRGMADRDLIWTYDEKTGKIRAVFVKTGLSDGQMTEICSGDLKEGMKVMTGLSAVANNTKVASKSILNSVSDHGGGPGGGPPPGM
ncbi:MAG: efflux RND transporter periplasmic adaptor subunit [Brevinematales bacterium]